jgi:cytochrome c peroxidase
MNAIAPQPRMFGILTRAAILALLLNPIGLLFGQSSGGTESPALPIGKRVSINAPLGLPPVAFPSDNPPTTETIALGRRLFYDAVLSGDGTVACATCHNPTKGFTDGKAVSTGIQNKTGTRSAPTVLNSAYYQSLFWDGRASSLEAQVEGPITNPIEMANTPEAVVQRLQASARYREEFRNAWGSDQITFEMVRKSIASFERTVLSGNSPFDRYYYGADKEALSASARRGFKVFTDPKRGNCAACHTIGRNYALFTDQKYHNIGIGANTDGSLADPGRYAETKSDADMGAFKTPSLRNAVWTAPYMHDGSVPSLKDVIDHYIGGGNSNPHLDKKIRVLDFLSGQERGDLLEFVQSLTGPMPPNVGPPDDLKLDEAEIGENN